MTKADIVREISAQTGIDREIVLKSLEEFVNVVKTSLSKGENLYVRGFGSFVIKKRALRFGRNISKNTLVHIPEHYLPIFKPSDIFVEKVKVAKEISSIKALGES